MSVTIDQERRRVIVRPDEPDADDILEYAEALISAEGWNRWEQTHTESSSEQGWTLHDAIGEANRRLFNPSRPVGDGKEGVTTSRGKSTREEATAKLKAVLPQGKDDKTWDNEQDDVTVVLAKLREARGIAPEEETVE